MIPKAVLLRSLKPLSQYPFYTDFGDSFLHSNEHPSPGCLFKSSHSSPFSITPFPHLVDTHTSLVSLDLLLLSYNSGQGSFLH